jgi:hypothetical protein
VISVAKRAGGSAIADAFFDGSEYDGLVLRDNRYVKQ